MLDDNKKLCLNSGEIIKLTPQMTMMFEVADLAVASPATVSRCAMIYMSSDQLGWRALVQSWVHGLREPLSKHKAFIESAFNWLLPPVLALVLKRTQRCCHSTVLHMVSSMLKLLTIAADGFFPVQSQPVADAAAESVSASQAQPEDVHPSTRRTSRQLTVNTVDVSASAQHHRHVTEVELPVMHSKIESMLVYCATWSIGCLLDSAGRSLFDALLRRLISRLPLGDLDCLPKSAVQLSSVFGCEVYGVSTSSPSSALQQHSPTAQFTHGSVSYPFTLPSASSDAATVFDFNLEIDGNVLGRAASAAAAHQPSMHGSIASTDSQFDGVPALPIQWIEWSPRTAGHPDSLLNYSVPPQTRYEDIIVPTAELVRNCRVMSILALNGASILAAGPTGTSKSVVIRQWLIHLLNDVAAAQQHLATTAAGAPTTTTSAPHMYSTTRSIGGLNFNSVPKKTHRGSTEALHGEKRKYLSLSIQFCARSTPAEVQTSIDASVSRRRVGMYGPPLGRKLLVMIDDLHMPAPDVYGCQPAIEFVRQWFDHGGWYDKHDKLKPFRKIYDVQFVSTLMTSAGNSGDSSSPFSGAVKVTQRLLRHFNVIGCLPYDDASLAHIFSAVMAWFVSDPQQRSLLKCDGIVSGSVALFKSLSQALRPTPSKSHYTFNLRDLSKVFQGVCQCNAKTLLKSHDIVRLWAHECSRVFSDRLVDDSDRTLFQQSLTDVCTSHLRTDLQQALQQFYSDQMDSEHELSLSAEQSPYQASKSILPASTVANGASSNALLFADFSDSDGSTPAYTQVRSDGHLTSTLQFYLDEYNVSGVGQRMSLVLFTEARGHVVRALRVLRQSQGHALFIGVGGSGRRSVVRLASYICGLTCMEYKAGDAWKDTLKDVMLKVCGCVET